MSDVEQIHDLFLYTFFVKDERGMELVPTHTVPDSPKTEFDQKLILSTEPN